MSFFQTLLNSYKPFQFDKKQPDNYQTSFIYSAWNSCYQVVDSTKDAATVYRRKVATETILFLLAYGISYVVDKKNYGEFEYKGFIWTVSKLLCESLIGEVKNYGINKDFVENRIFNYASLLSERDDNYMVYITVILNEQPLTQLVKSPVDFPKLIEKSLLARNLGEVLILNHQVVKSIELMKQAMIKSYGLR